jgi:hypothetical protein
MFTVEAIAGGEMERPSANTVLFNIFSIESVFLTGAQ